MPWFHEVRMILGINAGRARSGGAVAHIIGVLSAVNPADFGIYKVHVWSYGKLLAALPDASWLIKHNPADLEQALLRQLFWERFSLPASLKTAGCTMLLNLDAGSICRFKPAVTMSRDLLCYEPGEIARYGLSKASLRLIALRFAQNASLRSADGAVFLTRHASTAIQDSCGPLERVAQIPHGVGAAFQAIEPGFAWPLPGERPIRCLYISNAELYKHQWNVVKAIRLLRERGHDVRIELVGGGSGAAQERLEKEIADSDPGHQFVVQREFVPQHTLPDFLAQADLFVFASSCEAFGITLLEAMSAGLPIACSNRSSLPETLKDGGLYFDPENPVEIAAAIGELICDVTKRERVAMRAKELSRQYSWGRCARELFSFIAKTATQEA
jgi:glycosyltransferase involved in cell wall biosynthesis